VTYDEITALDSFTLSLDQGITGLLGPNGAGKSTLVKVLIGLKSPVHGEVSVLGMVPWKHSIFLREIVGYMPEHDCLIDEMNAISFVSYFGRVSGMEKEDTIWRAHEVLDFVGISEERYRKIGTYSTGMKQRVKLAQSLIHDPPILMLDEPTEGMDPDGRVDMLNLISEIGGSGKTILFCSHVLHEVERIADNIVIIDEGKSLKTGPIKDVLGDEDETIELKVLGDEDDLLSFKKGIKDLTDIYRSKIIADELCMLVRWERTSRELLQLAKDHNLQVRTYTPHSRTLEEVFFMTFKGGT